jgi:anti-sigma B factor antagonist
VWLVTDTDITPGFDFDIQATSIGETLVLEVFGDLDALTAPQLAEAIMANLADQPAALIVDLSKVDFLGSAGMTALIGGHEAAGSAQRFGVVADGPTGRHMKIVGLDGILSTYPTLAAALADIQ